ncbi:hypothetical protein QBC47DRAFT_395176 [Echria macrotheca]|uniref:Uncharacterized protein n=1 Tax=Echria macrotheca TaxID=438768 RepID=A0AAJ0F402_9PEZI|nr:hypothetical protein QBC47DRAFT_395176 [Echria macrotheca]
MPEKIVQSTDAMGDAIKDLGGPENITPTSLVRAKMDAQARSGNNKGRYAGVNVELGKGGSQGTATIRADWDPQKGPHINVTRGSEKTAYLESHIPGTDTERATDQRKQTLSDNVENSGQQFAMDRFVRK